MTPLAAVVLIIAGAGLVAAAVGVLAHRLSWAAGFDAGWRAWPASNESVIVEAATVLERAGLAEARRYLDAHPLTREDAIAAEQRAHPLLKASGWVPVTEPTPMPVGLAPGWRPGPHQASPPIVVVPVGGDHRATILERIAAAARVDPALASCYAPDLDPNSTGGGDIREVPCGSCPGCRLAEVLAELDGLEAGWRAAGEAKL